MMIATLALTILVAPSLQLHVVGEGYFQLETATGIAYAKSGSFSVRQGLLTHGSGFPILPKVAVPDATATIEATDRGIVFTTVAGFKKQIAQIALARFSNEAQPTPVKGVLIFFDTPTVGQPGTNGFGLLSQTLKTATPFSGSTTITVRERTELVSSQITVGDVAEITAPELLRLKILGAVIGPSPLLDTPRVITSATIQAALRSARVLLDGIEIVVPQRAVVVRASQLLRGEQIVQNLNSWVIAERPELADKPLITPVADRRIPVGSPDYTYRIMSETERAVVVSVEAKLLDERLFGLQIVINKAGVAKSVSAAPTAKVGQPVQVLLVSGSITVEATGKISWVGPDGRVKVVVDPNRTEMIGTMRPDGIVEVNL